MQENHSFIGLISRITQYKKSTWNKKFIFAKNTIKSNMYNLPVYKRKIYEENAIFFSP